MYNASVLHHFTKCEFHLEVKVKNKQRNENGTI
jgi:hypothetical protein